MTDFGPTQQEEQEEEDKDGGLKSSVSHHLTGWDCPRVYFRSGFLF